MRKGHAAMPIFLIIFLTVFGGGNVYVARRLYLWLGTVLPNMSAKIYICVYALIAVLMILGMMHSMTPFPAAVKSVLNRISAYWMGIFFVLLMVFVVSDIALLVGIVIKAVPRPIPGNTRFITGLVVFVLTAGLVIYGVINASRVKNASYEVELKDASLDGLRIVMISDSHLGAVNYFEKNLEGIVQKINALEPDVVCWAGDVFNDDFSYIRDPGRVAELLRSIDSTYGVYACYGNHDGGKTLGDMNRLLEQSNIKLLNDEFVIIDERLVLLGRLETRSIGGFGGLERRDTAELLASIGSEPPNNNLPIVVIDHSPATIGQYGNDVDLILAGHTHKGQVFPGNIVTNAMYDVDYGHYQKETGSPHVIVSSGVSTWGPPMRLGTFNEIVCIVLR